MSRRREMDEPGQAGAPLHMLSFADMMTNVLCFFILLCAFASERRVGFISDGLTSFRKALLSHGLPGVLSGDRQPMDLGADRVLFRPLRSISPRLLVEPDGRITDDNRMALRDVLIQALQSDGTTEIPVPLVFSAGSAELSREHRIALEEIAPFLAGGGYRILVEGFSWSEGLDPRAEWELALRRAENVRKYLAGAGDIPLGRFVPTGYGPASLTAGARPSVRQDRWGRRIVILSVGP